MSGRAIGGDLHEGGPAGDGLEDHPGSRVSGVRLLPSTITIAALCSGLSAIHFALLDQAGWRWR